MSSTPILGLTLPTVGASVGVWGTEVNTDLQIIDNLGAASSVSVSSSQVVVAATFPELIVLGTGGSAGITVTLPAPSSANKGKIFTIKKVDSGAGAVTVVPASGLIDGQASWILAGQYSHVRVYSDGANYDVIG